MDDLEVIKKYIKYYKIRLQSQINYHTVYRKKVVSEIITKKKLSKLISSSSMIKQAFKYIKTFKSYNDDIGGENGEIVHPKSFLLRFVPCVRRIALYTKMTTKWEPESAPTEPLDVNYIDLPYREYGIADYGDYVLMSKVESCYCYKYSDDYFLIKRKIDVELDFLKLYCCFKLLFERMNLYIPLSNFKELYEEIELNCENYTVIDLDDLDEENDETRRRENRRIAFENMKGLDLLKWK